MSIEPIIYGLIFIGVLVLVEGLYLVTFGKSISLNSRVNRRLEMLDKGTGREEVLEKLRKEMQQHMKSRSIPLYSLLAEKAQKAAIAFSPRQLVMIMAGLSLVAFLGLTVGTATEVPVRILLSIGIGVGAVYFWISSKASKRLGMIEEQLPDAVELMVRSLRVGHPFSAAVGIVSKEVADPLGKMGAAQQRLAAPERCRPGVGPGGFHQDVVAPFPTAVAGRTARLAPAYLGLRPRLDRPLHHDRHSRLARMAR